MKRYILLLFLFLGSINLWSADIPLRPDPPTLVNDYAGIFSNSQKDQLEQKLVSFFAETSNQIAVVTLPDLGGYEISDMAFRIGKEWGIGSSEFNNGILILVKPKTLQTRGQAFIAVGYGLEGAIPDITAKQIVEGEMIPQFKIEDMYGGIDRATTVLMEISRGEYNYQQYAEQNKGKASPIVFFIILAIAIFFLRGKRSYYSAGGKSSLPFWIAMGMMSSAGKSHSGSFGNFSSGSGGFGSFGGFGGGGFGGGGAGGSW
jgi:uncharacterized protein